MWFQRNIIHPIVRRKSKLTTVPVERYQLRIARTVSEYQDAFRLVHVGYAFEGIEKLGPVDLRITDQHLLPEATVIVAYEGERIVGTVSVTRDSPAGLPLDRDYPAQLADLRHGGALLAEIGSLAVVRRCWRTGVAQLLGLAAARLGFQLLGATHHVIGVHPKVAVFYQAMFGFDAMGECKQHADLHAPTQGLVQPSQQCFKHLEKYCARPMKNGISAFDYVFTAQQCPGLEMPGTLPTEGWPRWKMSRAVFRTLFVEDSARLSTVTPRTMSHLRKQRSENTLGHFVVAGDLQ